MKKHIGILFALLCAAASHGQTLTYQSAPFNAWHKNAGTIPCNQPDTSFYCLQMTVQLDPAYPLKPNMVNAQVLGQVTIISATFGLDPVTPIYANMIPSLYFTTDSTGKITGWNFSFGTFTADYNVITFIGSSVWDYAVDSLSNANATQGPGTWTQPSPATPPPVYPVLFKVATCPGMKDGTLWTGTTKPCPSVVYVANPPIDTIVGAHHNGTNEWRLGSDLSPSDWVYTDTTGPAVKGNKWWLASSVNGWFPP